jgi:hypothetical protein
VAIPGNFLSSTTESIDPNTSGWVAKLNCTISLGSGGRNGDGALKLTSAAAGEMQARTVSSYPVTAGTTYQAFCDGSGATVPDRIGIRWMTAANAEISISWSLTTATASSSWHRIAVGAVAPTGAVYAQVVVSAVTPAGAGVIGYFENVYLGYPITTTGNLLSYTTETLDVDASGWVAETNTTISRQAPAVQWSFDYYLAGGPTLAATVTANGNASAKTTAVTPATPGTEYIGFGYLNPPTSAANCWVELRFLDVGGTVLQATRSALAAPGTGWYRQIVSDKAPTGTVGAVLAFGITAGTAAQVVRFDAAALVAAATVNAVGILGSVPGGNIVPFADVSFEQGIGSWTVASGSATIARSTPWGNTALQNAYSLKLTFAGAGTTAVKSAKYPIGAGRDGQSWAAISCVNVPGTGWSLFGDILWYDASNALIATTPPSSVPAPAAGWWVDTDNEVVPAGAVSAAVQVTITAPGAGAAYLDSVSLAQAMPVASVTVSDDTASTVITLRALTAGDTLSLWRQTPDGTRTLVRGPGGLLSGTPITAESMVIEDYEAPLGVEVSYWLVILKPDGVSVRRTADLGGVTIPFDDINLCWLKDPGRPQRNLLLTVQTGPEWARPVEQGAYVVKNRRNKVTLSGLRNGREGDLVVWTQSDDERTALDWLLDSGATLLWQTHPSAGEGNVYVSIGQVAKARAGQPAYDPWRTWTLPLVEADMPVTVGVAGSAGRTWQDVLTGFATWADVLAAYSSWEDVLLDRRIGA